MRDSFPRYILIVLHACKLEIQSFQFTKNCRNAWCPVNLGCKSELSINVLVMFRGFFFWERDNPAPVSQSG